MTPQDSAGCGDDCLEALERIEAYLDGELSDDGLADLEQHLQDCHPCTDRADFEERVRALVRRGCAEQAPPGLLERIRDQLLDPSSPTTPAPPASPGPLAPPAPGGPLAPPSPGAFA